MSLHIAEINVDKYYGSRLIDIKNIDWTVRTLYRIYLNIVDARRARATVFQSRTVGRAPAYTLF